MSSAAHSRVRIELRLRELAQLFSSMDPSPFNERDLDANAEEFIVSWAHEVPSASDLELRVHLATPPPPEKAASAESAVQHFFAERAERKRYEWRQLMRRGRLSLGIGLFFLAACLGLSELVGSLGFGHTASLIRESLTIGGWVAMWRPLEIYLYDWWPLRDEYRALLRLARMRVNLMVHPPRPGPPTSREEKTAPTN